jgi:hypothetical protein
MREAVDVETMIAPAQSTKEAPRKYITLTQLCGQYGQDPVRARMRLRRAKVVKSMGLWSW